MCVKRETISGIIFDWLPLFENYFQSMMSHCGSRIKLNKAAGGRSRGGQSYISRLIFKGALANAVWPALDNPAMQRVGPGLGS